MTLTRSQNLFITSPSVVLNCHVTSLIFRNPNFSCVTIHYSLLGTMISHHANDPMIPLTYLTLTSYKYLLNITYQNMLIYTIPKLCLNLYSLSTYQNIINQHPDTYSLAFNLLLFIHWSHLLSDLSVGKVFREITPRTRLTCCVLGLQYTSIEELHLTSSSLIVDFDNASTSGISSVSCTSSFLHRNSLAPSVGKCYKYSNKNP